MAIESKEVVLNISEIRNQVAARELKQWWIAEQVGVDIKTVRRWLHGKVKKIKTENAQALANVLNVDLQSITLENEADLFATNEDQKRAAELLQSDLLLNRLGPIGEWHVIEAMLKATIVPNLPKFVLGEMYNQLCIASWRQSKIDQAELFADKALEVGRSISDRSIEAGALLNKANIYSWRGKTNRCLETYKEVMGFQAFISRQKYGSTLSNIGAVNWEIGNLDDALEYQELAIGTFDPDEHPMNLSIAWCQMAFVHLEMESFDDCNVANELARTWAKKAEYKRGLAMATLVEANLLACSGNPKAIQMMEEGMGLFESLSIDESLNYEFAGRVARLCGELDSSLSYLVQGERIAKDFPVYHARVVYEKYTTLLGLGRKEEAVNALNLARELFVRCEAPVRVACLDSIGSS